MGDRELNEKVVVITGASSGFGKGAAREFARNGASVVLAARRDQLLEDLAAECRSLGIQALSVPTDVSQHDEVENLWNVAHTQLERIDVWVNNAGVGALGRFEEIPIDDHVKVIETDLLGVVYGSYYAMRQFRAQGYGTLINVASVIGKVPSPYYASYAAAKHGVVGLSAVLRQELRENNIDTIRVSTIMPTSFDTPFFDHASNYSGHEVTPIPPVYEPEKVVDAIVRMATDPEDEISVGTAAKFSIFAHQVAPGMAEKMMGRNAHKEMMEKAPVADDREGAVHEPVQEGTELKRSA